MNLRRLAVFVTAASLAVAACGAAEVLAPRAALREAAQATADQSRTSVTVSLTGDEDDILTLFAEGGPVTDEDRKAVAFLRDSRMTFTTDRDSEVFGLVVDAGGVDEAFELRVVDRALYARVDLPGLMGLFEADPAMLDDVVAGARESGFDFLDDVVAGRWIRADLAPLEQMAEDMSGAGADGVVPDFGADQGRKLLDAVAGTWSEDVKVERLEGDHYRLTVPIRRLFARLLPAFAALGGLGFPVGEMIPPAETIPDRSVSAEVWVSDGKITRGELDLTQFAEGTDAGRVALRVDISSPEDAVEAPDDAVDIDLEKIFGEFLGLAMPDGVG